jgi:arylsulfatase A-like enzyme
MVKVSLIEMKLCLALRALSKYKVETVGVMLTSLLLTSCTWAPQRPPSILVIAVEGLSFDSFSCTSENLQVNEDYSGFKVFCDEAVKFTHAYTPSVMSQAAMASLLTGLYPIEHGLRNHGPDFLKAGFHTVAEQALMQGYQTSFISGGAPAWRKTGLSQGFEYFEDHIRVNEGTVYRPFGESVELFFRNLQQRVEHRPFFSVLFANDLQFADETTQNQAGEIRSKSAHSQLLEIGENLELLSQRLKKMGRWDDTYVILVGLNGGYFSPRPGEERAFSLYSSNTQVKLFIKPMSKKRDLALQWAIDRNVSLVDVGVSLWDLLGAQPKITSQFDVVSLSPVLKTPQVHWAEDRILMTESAWPSWQGVGVTRTALRMDQYLYIFDQRPQLFNTLIDRQEVARIDERDPLVKKPISEFREFTLKHQILDWRPLPDSLVEKLAIARELWRSQGAVDNIRQRLIHISRKRNWDEQIWSWRAQDLIERQRWEELLKLAEESGKREWEYLVRQNLPQDRKSTPLRGCYRVLRNFADSQALRDCQDPLFEALVSWVKESDQEKAIVYKEAFLRLYSTHKRDERIGQLNYMNGLVWSVNHRMPFGTNLTELALALPRMEGFSRQVFARTGSKNP